MKRNFITVILVLAAAILTISSCKKDKEDSKDDTNVDTTPFVAELYFRATIDGKVINFEEGVGGYAAASVRGSSTITSGTQHVQSTYLTIPFYGEDEEADYKNQGGFGIAKAFSDYYVEIEYLQAMFSIKSYPYEYNEADGAIITYTDNDGEFWSSNYGTGDQTGSTFAITEHTKSEIYYGVQSFITKAEFECTLYSYSTGESITLTNGVCRSRIMPVN